MLVRQHGRQLQMQRNIYYAAGLGNSHIEEPDTTQTTCV